MNTIPIAQFSDGACVVSATYNEATGRLIGLSADVQRGTLTIAIARQGGPTHEFTLAAGMHTLPNVPTDLAFGADPDTGAASITRGKGTTQFTWRE